MGGNYYKCYTSKKDDKNIINNCMPMNQITQMKKSDFYIIANKKRENLNRSLTSKETELVVLKFLTYNTKTEMALLFNSTKHLRKN